MDLFGYYEPTEVNWKPSPNHGHPFVKCPADFEIGKRKILVADFYFSGNGQNYGNR